MRNQWPGIVTAAVDNRFVQPAQDHRDAWCRLPLLLRRDSPSWAAQLAAPAVTGLSEQMQNTSAFRATRQLRHIARSLLHVTPCNRWQRQYRQGQQIDSRLQPPMLMLAFCVTLIGLCGEAPTSPRAATHEGPPRGLQLVVRPLCAFAQSPLAVCCARHHLLSAPIPLRTALHDIRQLY